MTVEGTGGSAGAGDDESNERGPSVGTGGNV